MAWIESHQELLSHPKTLMLAQSMEWNKFEAVGRLHAFWYWVMDYAPMGDLRKFNDAVLSQGVGLRQDEGKIFVDSMVTSGWIDRAEGVFRVHDWPQYAGQYLKNYKFKRRPELYTEMLRLYGAEERPVRKSTGQVPDKSETIRGLSADSPETVRATSATCRVTNQPYQPTDYSLRGQKAPARMSARTFHELEAKEFILRPDEKEFSLFVSQVGQLIAKENAARRNNPFVWIPQTGSFESDLRSMCYKISDEEKLRVLTDALNVLKYRWNWIDYVLIAIKATVRATLRERIGNQYGFTVHKLKHPHELVSAVADGNLSKPITAILEASA